MTSDQAALFQRRTLRVLRELTPLQRGEIVESILRDVPELAPVLSELLDACRSVRYMRTLGPIIRDSVSPR